MQVALTTADAGLHDAQLIPTLARKQDEVSSMVSTMAQLYVYGHDLDIRTLFSRASGPQDYANIPPTRFKRKEHWLPAHFSGDGSTYMPGTHVALRMGGTSGSTRRGTAMWTWPRWSGPPPPTCFRTRN